MVFDNETNPSKPQKLYYSITATRKSETIFGEDDDRVVDYMYSFITNDEIPHGKFLEIEAAIYKILNP